ncbi:MAG: UDP-N-acetylmuramate--L-alanine ligase [Chloroflexi bacterium]|nr:UDP-N-acetylmuramate--L-alanine ligase [Chloroflexota bacterium]
MMKKSVHFIGIGGTGLSGIARVLLERGYQVSGSDRQMSPLALDLQTAGARVVIGHFPENIAGADFIIRSSAIPDDHVEVLAARNAGIPVLKRADFLPELLAGKQTIAVAGTHGKTTATAMIAWMLSALAADPSFIVGSVVENLSVNARAGKGSLFVIEADEYDRMFLGIKPEIALVTNVEFDHPDCYPTPEIFHQAFVEFAKGILPNQGKLIACAEDCGSRRLISDVEKVCEIYSYGFSQTDLSRSLDFIGVNLSKNQIGCYSFTMVKDGMQLANVALSIPGRHNALNALGALAVIHELDLPVGKAAEFLHQFRGTSRRFEIQGVVNGVIIVDDYAHHPTEIKTALAAARDRFPDNRIIAVWQPHTYSRILSLWDEFVAAFSDADKVIVTGVYAAREQTPDNFYFEDMVKNIQHPYVNYQESIQDASHFLLNILKPGDVLIVLSAGDANKITQVVLQTLRLKEKTA